MKRWLIALLVLLPSTARAQQSAPQIPFDSVPNFLKLPADLYLGEAAGVAVNSKGHIFVFNRGNSTGPAFAATAAQLLEFGPDGTFIREIGHNLYAWSFAHSVRVDKDDNVWTVDKGSDMIVKFNPEGRVVMVFGRKKEASDEVAVPWKRITPPRPHVDMQFRQPTDVAWDPQGNTFISDGYINSRVAKIDKNGDWVTSWGDRGTGPGQFNTPHGIAVDAKGNVWVADRNNRRLQEFDNDGKFLRQVTIDLPVDPNERPWQGNKPDLSGGRERWAEDLGSGAPGAPWVACITPGPTQYIYTSSAFPGRVYKLNMDGKVLGMLGRTGRQPKQFGWIHEIACPSENEVYVAEILNWRVQKLILHPEQGKTSAANR